MIPNVLRKRVLELPHEGHQVGRPGFDKDAEQKCRECCGCQLVTKGTVTPPVKTTRMPERVWQDLAFDLLGRMPAGEYVLVLVDDFSGWVEGDVVKSTSSEVIIKCLDRQFSRYGVPGTSRSDNGPNLMSSEMEEYLNEMGIKHRLTTPLWLGPNGEVEQHNCSLLKAMRVGHAEERGWRLELNKFLLAYCSTLHRQLSVRALLSYFMEEKCPLNYPRLRSWRSLKSWDISRLEILMQ